MSSPITDRAREQRARRAAHRQGLKLSKRRGGWDSYGLADANTRWLVAGDTNSGYGLTLDEVEALLAEVA